MSAKDLRGAWASTARGQLSPEQEWGSTPQRSTELDATYTADPELFRLAERLAHVGKACYTLAISLRSGPHDQTKELE